MMTIPIEDAKAILHAESNILEGTRVSKAIRTVLASLDAATTERDAARKGLAEAVRLMEPVAGWLAADSNSIGRSDDDPFPVKTRWFRALASFVSRQKEAGRG